MGNIKDVAGKVAYGLLFIAVLPLFLIIWARQTAWVVDLPVPDYAWIGYILIITGSIFIITGILHLLILGKGLPMNAYPPKKLVKNGIYSIVKHPVYVGAVLLSFGLSLATGSASGLWLVTPVFILMIVVYVTGFENERTARLFGKQDYISFLTLPPSDNKRPSLKEIIATFILVFVPFLLVYKAFIYSGIPKDAITSNLPFEESWPIFESSVILYISAYVFLFFTPIVIKKRSVLRTFIVDSWFITIIGGLLYFALPFIVDQRTFVPESILGKIILSGRALDGQTCAFPSFHVIWAFISAKYFSQSIKRLRVIWYAWAVMISVSCITTGNHSLPDIIAGFTVYLTVLYRRDVWNYLRRKSENLANSWHEWRFGPLRVINHGFYGGAAGLAGMFLAGSFLGPQYIYSGFAVMIFVVIGAGLWAQYIEGSPKLLRPYGYYGGLTGGILACVGVSLISGVNLFYILASFAMAAPWIQAIGRLRCLVQGCCHGKPANENVGIRFTHPLSRVNKISELKGIPLHPTQLYSIGCNLVTGMILFRLYSLQMPAPFIVGMYLILNGLGRFIEESFRGEAQTPYWLGMRIYQWIAIINVFAGAVCTTIHNNINIKFSFSIESVVLAIIMGIIVLFASGVDFPESSRRFARLTSN